MLSSAQTCQSLKAWLLSSFLLLQSQRHRNKCSKAAVTRTPGTVKLSKDRPSSMWSSSLQNEMHPRAEPACAKKWGLPWTTPLLHNETMIKQTRLHQDCIITNSSFLFTQFFHLNMKIRSVPQRWAHHHWSPCVFPSKFAMLANLLSSCPTIIRLFSWHIVTGSWTSPVTQDDTFALNFLFTVNYKEFGLI